jgi:RNA polymerase sigma-70 factor (sigma-E family)
MSWLAHRRNPWDDEALEAFVARSSRSLLRSAHLLTGDRAAAEDLLQLTLLRVARRWDTARSAPEAYARRVLVNLARDRARDAGRRISERPLDGADVVLPVAFGGDLADAVAGRDAVIEALSRLPIRQREVLVLRFYGELSVAETAAAIGASEGTVKSYTSRALAHMRELLADEPPLSGSPEINTVEVEVPHDDR